MLIAVLEVATHIVLSDGFYCSGFTDGRIGGIIEVKLELNIFAYVKLLAHGGYDIHPVL